jgi:hypothetical protein
MDCILLYLRDGMSLRVDSTTTGERECAIANIQLKRPLFGSTFAEPTNSLRLKSAHIHITQQNTTHRHSVKRTSVKRTSI